MTSGEAAQQVARRDTMLATGGRVLFCAGGLLLLFAGFRVWGTGLVEWQAQRSLEAELQEVLDSGSSSPAILGAPASAPHPDAAALAADPTGVWRLSQESLVEGEVIGRIEIPAIELSKVLLHGVSRDTLQQGPGHYPGTPLPGWSGNAAVAGHRTTYGAPFMDIDLLEPGDRITIETGDGTFDYTVDSHPGPDDQQVGHLVVAPDEVEVVASHGDDRLTLTACHPKYSADQRIVVTATLIGTAVDEALIPPPIGEHPGSPGTWDAPSDPDPGSPHGSTSLPRPVSDDLASSYSWQLDEVGPTLLWMAVSATIVGAGLLIGRRRTSRLVSALTIVLLGPPVFIWFTHLDRLLPAF